MDADQKVYENRLRRMALRQDLLLRKCRRRDPRAIGYGGYLLVDFDNCVAFGTSPYDYSATLDEVEAYLTSD